MDRHFHSKLWWLWYATRLAMKMLAIAVLTIGAGAGAALVLLYMFGTPSADDLLSHKFSQTSVIYDRSGTHVLYKVHGEENRKIVAHDAIPDIMRQATIAAEDDGFYEHHGIDIVSTLRAVKVNVENESALQGGSTITQQLARNVFLNRKKTLHRKVVEALVAIKIERRFTKDEILDFYLNSIPYGSNAYGVQSAAETFFGKGAKDLTLDEATLLAALPKGPTYYSPYGNHRRELVARQRMIAVRMADLGMVDRSQVENILRAPTLARVNVPQHNMSAPHFVFSAIDAIEKQYGREALETGGLSIYTTLDWDLQQAAEKAVRDGVARNTDRGAENAALVASDPRTGELLAMVGSRDYFDTSIDGQVNVAERPRQPGSSFKPFAYAKAFEKGYQPETLLYDAPINFGPDGSGNDYQPNNYDGQFHGLLSMRQSLSNSLNIPAVETLYLAGVQDTIDLAHKMGITTLQDRNRYGLSLVLGGGEVKLTDMASAFGVFAADGVRHPAKLILKIVDSDGVVTRPGDRGNGERVLDAQVARKVSSILSDNDARSLIFGSRTPLAFPGHTVAAKTGTTQEFRDAWTLGYTQSLVVGVWVGNNDNRPMKPGSDGIFVAAPLWRDFMDYALRRFPSQEFPAYDVVQTDKPMLGGVPEKTVRYFKRKGGSELSFEEAMRKDPDKVRTEETAALHSILYYVNRNDPLGSSEADPNDPQLSRWEEALGYTTSMDSLVQVKNTNGE